MTARLGGGSMGVHAVPFHLSASASTVPPLTTAPTTTQYVPVAAGQATPSSRAPDAPEGSFTLTGRHRTPVQASASGVPVS